MEGLGKTLVAGAYNTEVLDRLRWFRDSFGPLLDKAIGILGGIDARELMAEAMMRGDELHNRNRAATSLFINQITLGLLDVDAPNEEKRRALLFLNGNGQFFVSAVLPAEAAARIIRPSSVNLSCQYRARVIRIETTKAINIGIPIMTSPSSSFE